MPYASGHAKAIPDPPPAEARGVQLSVGRPEMGYASPHYVPEAMRSRESLSKIFVAEAGGAHAACGELDEGLAAALAEARRMWPTIMVEEAQFVRHLARVTGGAADVLPSIRAGDLYLACAAAHGDALAIAEIERSYLPPIIADIARLASSSAEHDDIAQLVRVRLFVSEGVDPPKIAVYGGRGALGGFLRMVAVRVALGQRRKTRVAEQESSEEDRLMDLPSDSHPELEHLRSRYRTAFKAAFDEAMASLSTRERNLLRLHFLEGMSIDQLGALYRVHRSTAARWIARTAESLFEQTSRILIERQGLTRAELMSIMDLVRSQVDISIHRYLKAEGEG
jgi:RNA polymerase sigma-70 factor, ECF subfamily